MKRGLERIAKKDYPRAILEFRNAAAEAPKDPEPYYQIGLASLAEGDVSGALTALAKANELNPEDARPQVKLAEILTGSGRQDFIASARNRLQTLLKTSPDDPEMRSDLADAELLLGDADDAGQNLEQALQKSPTYLRASIQLSLLQLKRKDLAGAEESFRKAVEAAPASSEAAAALGQFYMVTREPAKAEAQFRNAIQLNPQNANARMSLGAIEIAANRLAEAEQTYKELSNLGIPKYRPIHAIFLYQTGKLDAALVEFEKQAKDRPRRSRRASAPFPDLHHDEEVHRSGQTDRGRG